MDSIRVLGLWPVIGSDLRVLCLKFVQLDSARVLLGNLYSGSGLSVFYFKLDSARVQCYISEEVKTYVVVKIFSKYIFSHKIELIVNGMFSM